MNVNVVNLKGERGGIYIPSSSPVTGYFDSITALEACVADLVSANIEGTLTSVPIPAGVTIYGRYSSITLNSGKALAYNAPNAV